MDTITRRCYIWCNSFNDIIVDDNYIGKESIYRLYNVSNVPNKTSISLGT